MNKNIIESTKAKPTPNPRLTFTEQSGCISYRSEATQGAESEDEAEMNVRLWNAAPELLEELGRLVRIHEQIEQDTASLLATEDMQITPTERQQRLAFYNREIKVAEGAMEVAWVSAAEAIAKAAL